MKLNARRGQDRDGCRGRGAAHAASRASRNLDRDGV